jgi:hypothetical protein
VSVRVLRHALLGVVLVQPLARGEAAQAEGPPAGGPALAVGVRVRVTAATGQKVVGSIRGTLIALDDDLMTVAIDDGRGSAPLQLPIRTVSKVEVSRGRKDNALVGAIVGLAGGAALGSSYPSVVSADCTVGHPNCGGSLQPGLTLAVAGIGAVLGAFVGHLIRTERWTRVDVRGLDITLRPGPSLGAAVTIRF